MWWLWNKEVMVVVEKMMKMNKDDDVGGGMVMVVKLKGEEEGERVGVVGDWRADHRHHQQ